MTLAALTLAVALQAQYSYSLKWEPKKGATLVYEYYLKDPETTVEATLEHKVTELTQDGSYTVTSRSLGALVRIAGNEFKDERPNEAKATYDSFGRLKELTEGTTGLEKYRSALLTKFVAPEKGVAVGTTWTYERPKDDPKGLAAIKIEYRVADHTADHVLVQFTFTELGGQHPQTATGTWWVSKSRERLWVPVRMEAKVKNFLGSPSENTDVRLVLRTPA